MQLCYVCVLYKAYVILFLLGWWLERQNQRCQGDSTFTQTLLPQEPTG